MLQTIKSHIAGPGSSICIYSVCILNKNNQGYRNIIYFSQSSCVKITRTALASFQRKSITACFHTTTSPRRSELALQTESNTRIDCWEGQKEFACLVVRRYFIRFMRGQLQKLLWCEIICNFDLECETTYLFTVNAGRKRGELERFSFYAGGWR